MAVIVSNDSVTKVEIIFQLRFIGILDFLLFCTTKGDDSKKKPDMQSQHVRLL
jgi:hypothetical protein